MNRERFSCCGTRMDGGYHEPDCPTRLKTTQLEAPKLIFGKPAQALVNTDRDWDGYKSYRFPFLGFVFVATPLISSRERYRYRLCMPVGGDSIHCLNEGSSRTLHDVLWCLDFAAKNHIKDMEYFRDE